MGDIAAVRKKAVCYLILATLFWGLSFPLIKALALVQEKLLPGVAGWFMPAYALAPRFVAAALLLGLVFCWKRPGGIARSEWKQGLGLSLFCGTGMLFQIDGLRFVDASVSAFLTQFYVLLIPLYVAVRRRRLPNGRLIWCLAAVLAGVAILSGIRWGDFRLGRGEAETLLASLFFMGQVLWLERRGFQGNRVLPVSLVMFGGIGVLFSAVSAATAPRAAALVELWGSGSWVGITAALAVFSTVGAFMLMNAWQPKLTATEAGLIYCCEPVFASVLALFLPGILSVWAGVAYVNEVATTRLLLGGGLILAANLGWQIAPGKEAFSDAQLPDLSPRSDDPDLLRKGRRPPVPPEG